MDDLPGPELADSGAGDTGNDSLTPDGDVGSSEPPPLEDSFTDVSLGDDEDAADAAPSDTGTGEGSVDAADARPDSGLPDSTVDGSDATDAADAVDSTSGGDSADGNPCSGAPFIGLSEVMVRTIGSSGDTHEWFEIANFSGACVYDVGGLRVRALSASGTTWIEKATYTLPAGTTMPPGAAFVFADVRSTFLTDAGAYYALKGLDTNRVYDLGKTVGDVMPNSADLLFEVYAPGATLPTDSVIVKTRTWPVGQSRSLPLPCDPLTGRLTGSPATTSAHWIDTPSTSGNQYGTASLGDAGASALYGTPGRVNDVATTCP
jgi:hypothetical protein